MGGDAGGGAPAFEKMGFLVVQGASFQSLDRRRRTEEQASSLLLPALPFLLLVSRHVLRQLFGLILDDVSFDSRLELLLGQCLLAWYCHIQSIYLFNWLLEL